MAIMPAIFCLLGPAFALCGPENVLVVQNTSSRMSSRIASYYMSKRGIPAGNLFSVSMIDSSYSSAYESISLSDYQTKIENPIRLFLFTHNLRNQIQYIVLTKGIPHRISTGPTGGKSVDSLLAAMDLVNPLVVNFTLDKATDTAYANRYWHSGIPFTHAQYGGYLVTRLDGYTEADAKALVDRAMLPQLLPHYILMDIDASKGLGDPSIQPKSLLYSNGTIDPDYTLYYSDYNADMTHAWQTISNRPQFSTELETTNTFVGSSYLLTGYISWGSNDSGYSANVYHSLRFITSSIVEIAVSTSARTLLPTSGGQSLIADLIAQGAAGAKGYVTEPFIDALASPTILMDFYTSGRNLAESYYGASRFVGWKDVVLGDPLCRLTGATVQNISQAKNVPDGTLISLSDKIVSAGTEDFGNRFYIQESDRSSGIQVYLGGVFPGITKGMTVSVRGILAKREGERIITNASVVGTSPIAAEAKVTTSSINSITIKPKRLSDK